MVEIMIKMDVVLIRMISLMRSKLGCNDTNEGRVTRLESYAL